MIAINQLYSTRWSLIAQCGIIASFIYYFYGTLLRGLFAEVQLFDLFIWSSRVGDRMLSRIGVKPRNLRHE